MSKLLGFLIWLSITILLYGLFIPFLMKDLGDIGIILGLCVIPIHLFVTLYFFYIELDHE